MTAAGLSSLRVALCHDYLIKIGGAERVLEALHKIFPDAPVYTLLYDQNETEGRYHEWDIRTSGLQGKPLSKRGLNYYRAFMPQATEAFDLTDYDLVISDSHSFIKGVITQPHTLHVAYIHTPARFLWFDVQNHIERAKFSRIAKLAVPPLLHRIRQWDFISAQRPDVLIANSRTTQARVKKFYRRESIIVNPPVALDRLDYTKRNPGDYFLIVSRLEPHKQIDIAIEAANRSRCKLVIAGRGSDLTRLQQLAGPTVEFYGRVSDDEVRQLLYTAKAFVAPQIEDFGITMVEAIAAGCPVIAQAAGGATEIVVNGKNGIVVEDLDERTLSNEMLRFDSSLFNAREMSESVTQFSETAFANALLHVITQHMNERNYYGAA